MIERMNQHPLPASSPSLSDDERAMLESIVTSLEAAERGISAFEGLKAQLLTAALELGLARLPRSGAHGDLPVREIAAEIGAALRVSDRTVQRRLDQARELTARFPAVHDALTSGRIGRAHVNVIVEAGAGLDDAELRRRFEAQVLAVAERESAARLAPVARAAAERLMPRTLEERHGEAVEHRRVAVVDLDDAMSELSLVAPATLVHGIFDRLTQQAREVASTGGGRRGDDPGEEDPGEVKDARTLDQLRADLLCDIALTAAPRAHEPAALLGAIRAEVALSVPVLTLAGRPGDAPMLDGTQPVDVPTAVRLVGGASGWDRVLTHPVSGGVLAVDRYRPSARLRRFLRAIDERCRFPACRLPARRCDVDHVHDAALGGPTVAGNLTDLCRRHHVLKHHSAWTIRKQADGTVLWTGPTGRRYPDRLPRVAFADDEGPPPF